MVDRVGTDPDRAALAPPAPAEQAFKASERRSGGRPFVGRAAEVATLLDWIREAGQGNGRLALITGAPGIGKTAVAEEAIARAGLPRERVLRGRCVEQPGAPAFLPWRRMLRDLFDGLDADALRRVAGPEGWVLGRVLPALESLLPPAPDAPPADPLEQRFALLDAIAATLLRAASREPLLVFLDDLHWTDPSSFEVLAYLAPELTASRLIVIGTHRDPPGTREAPSVARYARIADRIALAGLGDAEAGALVEQLAGTRVAPSLLESIQRLTRGNPFFIDETVRLIRARGDLGDAASAVELPETVREVIRRHTAPLEPAAREVLTAAAVLGHEFEVPALCAALEIPPAVALERLGAAATAGLIEPAATTPTRHRFVHALIAETLYADLTPLARAELHRSAANALERIHASSREPPAGALAYHYFRAAPLGGAEHAVAWSVRAGRQAIAARAWEEAAGQLAQALDALAIAGGDDAERVRLLLELARAQTYAGLMTATATFESAIRTARTLGDHRAVAEAAIQSMPYGLEPGAIAVGLVAALEEALRAMPEEDSALRAGLLARLASASMYEDHERALALSAEAEERARRLGEPAPLAAALLARHLAIRGPDSTPAARIAVLDELVSLAERAGDHRLVIDCERWRIADLLEGGALAEAERAAASLARRCAEWRLPLFRLHARLVDHTLVALRGRYDELAAALADDDAGPLAALRPMTAQSWEASRLALRLERGGLEMSEGPARAMLQLFPDSSLWRGVVSMLCAEQGRIDEARATLASFASGAATLPRDALYIPTLAVAACVAARIGDAAVATAVLPGLRPHVDRHVVFGVAANGWGSVARYAGLVACASGDVEAGIELLERAIAANDAAGIRPFAAWSRFDLAAALRTRGREGDRAAADVLDCAVAAEANALGMTVLLERLAARAPDAVAAAAERPRSAASAATLRREGDVWSLAYADRIARIKHAKGLVYLAHLLERPQQEVHALDLAATAEPAPAAASVPGAAAEASPAGLGDAGEMIDAQARDAYAARLEDLRDELEEAERFGDPGRAERAREEIEFLTDEIARGTGLGGRLRRAGSASERARVNVTRAITAVLRRIAEDHPALGEHLAASIRTGTFCSYAPDPRVRVEWVVQL